MSGTEQVGVAYQPSIFADWGNTEVKHILGGKQMYQALRSLGVETQLVIYPSQFHGLTVPSYKKDRYDRYLGWFSARLKPKTF